MRLNYSAVAETINTPGPAQLSIAFSTASDRKLGGAWEQGKLFGTVAENINTTTFSTSALPSKEVQRYYTLNVDTKYAIK